MTHDTYRELIQRELDDDLSSDEMALLEAHVATCADCRREREQYHSLVIGLSRLSQVMPERSFVPQITPEIPTVQTSRQRRLTPTWWRGLSVAAVVVLAVGWATQWSFTVHPHRGGKQLVALGSDSIKSPRTQPPGSVQQQSNSADSHLTTPDTQSNTQPQTIATVPTQTDSAKRSAPMIQTQSPTSASKTPAATNSSGSAPVANSSSTTPHSTQSTHSPTTPTGGNNTTGQGGSTDVPIGAGTGIGNGAGTVPGTIDAGTQDSGVPGGMLPALAGGESTPPPANIIGPVPALNNLLNEQLQAQVNGGDVTAQWAINPYQVVQHTLTALGFAKTATVMPMDSYNRVHVLQGGRMFEITLQQPFDQGLNGIWMPVQIGRAIDENRPEPMEKPVLEYFTNLMASGTLTSRRQIFVVRDTTPASITVTVDEEHQDASGQIRWINVQYEFNLQQQADQSWSLIGAPTTQMTETNKLNAIYPKNH